jgi:hypothetical protein
MTYVEDEATRLFVTAEEEDAEREAVVVAPGMPICGTGHSAEPGREATESGLGHSPLLPLQDDCIVRRSRQIRVSLRADLEAELSAERAKAGF